MGKKLTTPPQARRTATGPGAGAGSTQPATHTPVTSLRIAPALLARADELVPLVAASGEMVGVSRSLILRLALAEGLRVLARRYGRE